MVWVKRQMKVLILSPIILTWNSILDAAGRPFIIFTFKIFIRFDTSCVKLSTISEYIFTNVGFVNFVKYTCIYVKI